MFYSVGIGHEKLFVLFHACITHISRVIWIQIIIEKGRQWIIFTERYCLYRVYHNILSQILWTDSSQYTRKNFHINIRPKTFFFFVELLSLKYTEDAVECTIQVTIPQQIVIAIV